MEDNNFKNWLIKSDKNKKGDIIEYGSCKVCNVNIFPNRVDLLRHAKSEKHSNMIKTINTSQSLEQLLNKKHFHNVRTAELKLAAAITVANVPFKFMDILSPLCGQIFPDSKIAKDLSCRRLKTTTIIKENIGKLAQEDLWSILKEPGFFFSLIMDETTDVGTIKQCAFTVIFFSAKDNKVVTRFFDIIEVASGTANDLYMCLKSALNKNNIPLANLVGFASDTTNVMVGDHNSIFSHLKADLPEIALIKCSCHMIHLCASKACLELPRSVEDLLRNIGAHFSRSFGRQEKLKEFQEFFGTEVHKILLPSQTRWLSLEQCCSRVLEQYDPLTEYSRLLCFEDPSITNDQIFSTITNKFTKIYLEFMAYILHMLNAFNKMFQSESPLLYKLKPSVIDLLKNICCNFMEPSYVKTINLLHSDNYRNPRHLVSNDKLYLGIAAHESIQDLKKDPNFDHKTLNDFYSSCLKFYLRLVKEIKQRFTFEDELFNIVAILDPKYAQAYEQKSLGNVLNRFSFLNNFVHKQILDNEWRSHALLDHSSLGLNSTLPAEHYWTKVFELKNAGGTEIYPNLKVVMNFLLILPFSNASVERLFSDLNNVKTDLRNKLKTDTVAAILATKDSIKNQGGIFKFTPTDKMINAALWAKK